MKKSMIFAISSLAVSAIAITGMAFGSEGILNLELKAAGTYSCVSIDMTETVNNPASYSDAKAVTFATLQNLGTDEVATSSWTNANYKELSNGAATSAIKIGGSKTSKYAGSVVFSFATVTIQKVILYASSWSNDGAASIQVDSLTSQSVPETVNGAYSFSAYTFTLATPAKTFTITNAGATTKKRIVISKIVLRIAA